MTATSTRRYPPLQGARHLDRPTRRRPPPPRRHHTTSTTPTKPRTSEPEHRASTCWTLSLSTSRSSKPTKQTADPYWPVDKLRARSRPDGSGRRDGRYRSLRIGPPPFDPAQARPRAIVYVHLSQEALRAGTGVARVEDIGPVLLSRLRQVLGTRCQIQLKPVIDVNDQPAPVDSYEIPARIAEHLRLRQPTDVFPYAAGGSRRTDLDHTIPYRSPDTVAARPVRPRSGTSDRWSATTTESRPTAAGTCDNPNPAAGSGGRLTDASSWSTAPVLTRSANPASPNRSGAPPKHRQRLIRAIRPKELRSRESCAPRSRRTR